MLVNTNDEHGLPGKNTYKSYFVFINNLNGLPGFKSRPSTIKLKLFKI